MHHFGTCPLAYSHTYSIIHDIYKQWEVVKHQPQANKKSGPRGPKSWKKSSARKHEQVIQEEGSCIEQDESRMKQTCTEQDFAKKRKESVHQETKTNIVERMFAKKGNGGTRHSAVLPLVLALCKLLISINALLDWYEAYRLVGWPPSSSQTRFLHPSIIFPRQRVTSKIVVFHMASVGSSHCVWTFAHTPHHASRVNTDSKPFGPLSATATKHLHHRHHRRSPSGILHRPYESQAACGSTTSPRHGQTQRAL